MNKSPKIQNIEPDVFHYGHSLYFTRVNTTTMQNVARVIVSVKVKLYTFQGIPLTLPLNPKTLYT